MSKSSKCWFPAKRYGWGWGFPVTWQGWCVLVIYLFLLIAAAMTFDPVKQKMLYVGSLAGLSFLLIAICWWKGEKPQWRWGEDKKPE